MKEKEPTSANSRMIIIVDDDEVIRTLLTRILRRDGHEVLTASNGDEAIHLIQEYRERIDVVVTDFVMPGMNGQQLIEAIRRKGLNIKFICMSGFAKGIDLDENIPFIQKPFTPKSFLSRLQTVLPTKY